jgi:hypothetical protein
MACCALLTMPDPLITLTTDFGESSPFVAAMKGVILAINPSARLVDLSHQIPPQELRCAGCGPTRRPILAAWWR